MWERAPSGCFTKQRASVIDSYSLSHSPYIVSFISHSFSPLYLSHVLSLPVCSGLCQTGNWRKPRWLWLVAAAPTLLICWLVCQRCQLDFTLWNWKPHLADEPLHPSRKVSTGKTVGDICYLRSLSTFCSLRQNCFQDDAVQFSFCWQCCLMILNREVIVLR